MEWRRQMLKTLLAAVGIAAFCSTGCGFRWPSLIYDRPSATPLGTLSDPIWQNQEMNAERSDFVVHEHEFVWDAEFLNAAGEDHLRQIAARLASGQDSLVVVERSRNSARPDTEHKYPVHLNPDLDMRRREIVARSLVAMGVPQAETRVVVAPDLAPQYRAQETASVYFEGGQTNRGNFGGGYGGGGFGGGFGGGYGGGFGANTGPSSSTYAGSGMESGPIGSTGQGYRR